MNAIAKAMARAIANAMRTQWQLDSYAMATRWQCQCQCHIINSPMHACAVCDVREKIEKVSMHRRVTNAREAVTMHAER